MPPQIEALVVQLPPPLVVAKLVEATVTSEPGSPIPLRWKDLTARHYLPAYLPLQPLKAM